MIVPVIRTERLVLNRPTVDDIEMITELCQDPELQHWVPVPRPYRREHAAFFIGQIVDAGWASGAECTWALRETDGGPLLGVIGWRRASDDIGYWLGAPHRGRGLMAEALQGASTWLLGDPGDDADRPLGLGLPSIGWFCAEGNTASALTARSAGFRYLRTGELPVAAPGGAGEMGWFARRDAGDDPDAHPEWPVL